MASEHTAAKRVLSRSITTFFEDEGYLDVVTNKKRNVSGLLPLTGASPRTLSSSTASSGGTVSSASFTLSRSDDWTQRVEVPEVLESIESLQYLGVDLPTARTILARYLAELEPQSGDPLLSWACAHVGGPHWVTKVEDRSEAAFLD